MREKGRDHGPPGSLAAVLLELQRHEGSRYEDLDRYAVQGTRNPRSGAVILNIHLNHGSPVIRQTNAVPNDSGKIQETAAVLLFDLEGTRYRTRIPATLRCA